MNDNNEKKVTEISIEEIDRLQKSSFMYIPNNPSERGMKPDEIRHALYKPFIDNTDGAISLLKLMQRLIKEMNDLNTYYIEKFNSINTFLGDINTIEQAGGIAQAINNLEAAIDTKVDIASIIDNLTSTEANKPLSANQGKILNDKVTTLTNDKLSKGEVINDLNSTDVDKPLSANQGKVLFEKINSKTSGSSFDNIEEMVTNLNAINNVEEATERYRKYDNIYIVQTSVPDFWITEISNEKVEFEYINDADFIEKLNMSTDIQVGYLKLAKLETEKVILDDYQKMTNVATYPNNSETIVVTLNNNEEHSFNNPIVSATINIPANVKTGYYSSCSIKIGSTVPHTFDIVNHSVFNRKIMLLGSVIDVYTPPTNKVVNIYTFCDGNYVYIVINEA